MNDPLSTSAPVLKPFDAASIYERQGEFTLQPLLERKQKMQQAQSEFAGVMGEIEKYANEVWEQDWQQISKAKDEYMEKAAQAYEKAYMEGRDMSVMEKMQVQKGLNQIGRLATTSKQNKELYETYAKEIMKNPDKYDVQASMALLNSGYRDKNLGERSIDTFMIPKLDWGGFMKDIQATTITKKSEGPRGGSASTVADEKAIRAQIITKIQNTPWYFEYVLSLPEDQQGQFIEGLVKQKATEVNRSYSSTAKEYTPKYKVSSGVVKITGFSGTKQPVVQITTKPAERTIKIGQEDIVLDRIALDSNGNPVVIGYVEYKLNQDGVSRTANEVKTIPYENIKSQVQGIGGDELIREIEKLSGGSGGGSEYFPTTKTANAKKAKAEKAIY